MTRYLVFTPSVAGLPLELAGDDSGAPTVVLGEGAVQYTVEQVE